MTNILLDSTLSKSAPTPTPRSSPKSPSRSMRMLTSITNALALTLRKYYQLNIHEYILIVHQEPHNAFAGCSLHVHPIHQPHGKDNPSNHVGNLQHLPLLAIIRNLSLLYLLLMKTLRWNLFRNAYLFMNSLNCLNRLQFPLPCTMERIATLLDLQFPVLKVLTSPLMRSHGHRLTCGSAIHLLE